MVRARSWFRFSAMMFVCGAIYLGFAAAQETGDTKKTPPKLFQLPTVIAQNRIPTNVEELRDIEKHVKKVLEKVMPSVVGVRVGFGQGSGVIVKEDGTILTAGHVSGKSGQTAVVILPNAKTLKGKTLGGFSSIDSGMMKITDEGKYPHLEMGKSSELKVGQWVIGIGHPGGFRPNRTPVVRVGRILMVNSFVIQTDCTLVGGDSGGPLFDMQGRVIGIHSRIGGFSIRDNMHVPIDTYQEHWTDLASGKNWGGTLGQMPTVMSMGGKIIFERKDKLTTNDGTEPSPKDKSQKSHRKLHTVPFKAGHTYTIDLISDDKSGKKLDTFLRLESPEGKDVAHDDDGGGFPHSRLVHRATKDGDYRLIATSFEPDQTGGYTLTVRDADFYSGKIEVLKAVKLSPPNVEKALKELNAKKVQLNINAMLVDDQGTPLVGKEVTVNWTTGKETLKSDGQGLVRWTLKTEKSKKLNIDLPKGIRAALVLTDQDGRNIFLGQGKDDPSLETVKSAGGKIVKTFDGTLGKTDPFDAEREKCFRHVHEFKMQPGKTYTLDLASEDFDAYLRVEHEDKGKLAEDDDGGSWNNSRIVFTPTADGTYRLVVTTCYAGEIGGYRLTVRETTAKGADKKKDLPKDDKK